MTLVFRRWRAHRILALLPAVLAGCSTIGMSLPFDDTPPAPEGWRIKPSYGWVTTKRTDDGVFAPEGLMSVQVVRVGGRAVLQQVRHLERASGSYGDSVLLDRNSLRPIATWRWTPKGTYITRYNFRSVERTFRSKDGRVQNRSETLEMQPYSALGMELVVAALPLSEGATGYVPVAVDTAARGWMWLKYTVMREYSLIERPDLPMRPTFIVDCDMFEPEKMRNDMSKSRDISRTRLYIATEGRSVRQMQQLTPDNEVISVLRRVLVNMPPKSTTE